MEKNTIDANYNSSEPMVSAYLHSKANAQGIPLSGTFEITGRCNFNCKMCYVHNSDCQKMKATELPAEWWINLGKEAVEAGMVFLLITGGEPLLRDDFEEIYTELSRMGCVISLNTNGYLINDRIKSLFEKNPPNRVNISLYGSDNASYEKFTGVKAFDRVVANVTDLRSIGVDAKFNCSITPDNCGYMENIYEVSKRLGFHIKTTSYMFPQMRLNGVPGENENRLSAQVAAQCRVSWSKLQHSPEEFISRAKGMKRVIDEKLGIEGADNPAQGVLCRAGRTAFWVDREGRMSPCGIMDKTFDIKELGFSQAWEQVKQYVSEILLPKECSNCAYRHLCNVCAAACYSETGSFSKKPEYLCRMTKETARLVLLESERMEKNGN